MPKQNIFLPTEKSCDRIQRLLIRHIPQVLVASSKKVLSELANIENGSFHRRIERYRCVGRRFVERQKIQEILLEKGIESNDICIALNVDLATVGRFFNGKSATDLNERIFNRYHRQLNGFKHPNQQKVYYHGYQHAIVKLREDVLKGLGEYSRPNPFLSNENFCYLWHILKSDPWRRALQSEDEPSLDAATANVSQQVKRTPPTCENCEYKSPLDLKQLHKVWGLWFRIVIYCEIDQAENEFNTE